MDESNETDPGTGESERELARRRIQKRRGLQTNLVAFVVVNAFLVGVWALTGGGYFWPGWVIGAWAIGVVMATWDYYRGQISEADIDAELRRRR